MPRYHPAEIEPRWQAYWEQHRTFRCPEFPAGEKLYVLDMFPYPSGDGLHVGHPEGYTATDIVCRAARMRGRSVLHPMGFDAFGLPAEEHAIKTGTHPRVQTEKNIARFRAQLKSLGFSYDWDRELATTDVAYFRWTQFIFLLLFDTWFDPEQQRGRPICELPIPPEVQAAGPAAVARFQDEHRLAYQSDAPVNWCPALGTVLANEEVIDGLSERGGHPVVRMPLRQWMLRITAYADRLEKDLESLEWSEGIKALQRNWIGRSTGAEVDFYIGDAASTIPGDRPKGFEPWQAERAVTRFPRKPGDDCLRVYTTRPDTLYGATYMVLAPEHPFLARLTTPAQAAAVRDYCELTARKSDRERQEEGRRKSGVFTGSYAINPVNGEAIPVWIADYVLISYGTGAIMAVPAHDTRDMEFARQFGIRIWPVVHPPAQGITAAGGVRPLDPDGNETLADEGEFQRFVQQVLAGQACYTGHGRAINSGPYDGLATAEFKPRIVADLATAGLGRQAVNYKLRDWLFSRQRFWGEPFPILHELDAQDKPTGAVRAVPLEQLPVDLPHLDDFRPPGTPEAPLTKAPDDWLHVTLDGRRYRRETNTMPQWAGSCWYYLRFIDPRNDAALVDRAQQQAWMPVDLYVGGAEHAVLHLLYARFWHKVLFDRGYVSTAEPFPRLVNQGMILGEMEHTGYQLADGQWVSAIEVATAEDGRAVAVATGQEVTAVRVDANQVERQGDRLVLRDRPEIRVESRAHKMSKSRGNVVNPDEVVREYGADSLRLYEMFMGPLEATKPWSMAGVSGVRGFLDRVWRMMVDERAEPMELSAAVQDVEPTGEQLRVLHKTIRAVTHDVDTMSFNTAIARMMEFVNYFTRQEQRPRAVMEPFVLLLSPFAPHICEELWRLLGHDRTLAYEPWPRYEQALTVDETIEVPVQISGKLRARVQVAADISRAQLEQVAREDPRVAGLLEGKQVVKVVVVPGRLVNFVTR